MNFLDKDGYIYPERSTNIRSLDGLRNILGVLHNAGKGRSVEENKKIVQETLSQYKNYFINSEMDGVPDFVQKIDVHVLITDIIRDLIRKATGNSNIIVLVPDLNYTHGYAIQQLLQEQQLKIQSSVSNAAWPEELKKTSARAYKASVEREKSFYTIYNSEGKLFYVLLQLLARFGISLDSSRTSPTTVKRPDQEKEFRKDAVWGYNQAPGDIPSTILGKTNAEGPNEEVVCKLLQVYLEQDESRNYKDTQEMFFKDRTFTGCITKRSDNGFPDYWGLLKKISSEIKKGSTGVQSPNIQLFYESDTKLLDIWANSTYSSHPLFGGYDRVYNSENGAIIYGDQRLIREYLYGATRPGDIALAKKKVYDFHNDQFTQAKDKYNASIADTEEVSPDRKSVV